MKRTEEKSIEVSAIYSPDNERMIEALMLVLDLDPGDLPCADHSDALRVDAVC